MIQLQVNRAAATDGVLGHRTCNLNVSKGASLVRSACHGGV